MVESVGTSGTQDAYATMRARRHSSARVRHDGANTGDLSGVQAGSGVADRDDWTRAANAAKNGATTQTQATASPSNPVNAQIAAFLLQFQDVASGQGAANANGASTGGDNGSTDALNALPGAPPSATNAAAPSSGGAAFDAAFARLDANGDGSIDRNEAQAAVSQSQSRHHHHHHGGGHGGGTTTDPATATTTAASTTTAATASTSDAAAASTAAAATGNTLSAALLAQLQAA